MIMNLRRALVAAVALSSLTASPALAAGPYTDELSKCLVRSTTAADKTLLVQWMFATASLHPEVKWMAKVSDAERTDLIKKAAALFGKLLTESCVSETRQAWKYEGQSTIESSFAVLGQVATRELFAHPRVAEGLSELGKHFDGEKLTKALEPGE